MAKTPPSKPSSRGSESRAPMLSPLVQDILSIVVLYTIALIVFHGIVFDDTAFSTQADTAASLSYSHTGLELQKAEGVDAVWMPGFFSGMPTFGNVAFIPHNVNYVQWATVSILNYLFMNRLETWYIVLYFLGGVFMFLLARTWDFDRIPSLIAGITFMLSPYAVGLASEGHGSKLMALTYLPLVMLLIHKLFEKRTLLWFGLTCAGLGTLLLSNHMQMVYYIFIVAGLYLVYHSVLDFKERKSLIPVKAFLLIGALAVGLCISAYIYLSVYEYAQFSMRGGGTAGSTGGLTYDYATNWSWSIWDAISLLIPGFYGLNGTPAPPYWGHVEPWTNAYVYVGLVPVFLCVIALTFKRNGLAIFLSVSTVLVVLISLGRNFPVLYDLMFAVLPFFNKFRAPQMILHLLPFLLGILGAIGYTAIDEQWRSTKTNGQFTRVMMIMSGVAGGVLLLSFAVKTPLQELLSGFLFVKDGEVAQLKQQYGAQAQQAVQYFKQLRFDIFWKDYVKFLVFVAAISGAIALYVRRTISATTFGVVLVALAFVDLAIIDGRIINPQPRRAIEENFTADATVAFLKQEPGLFRVLPLPLYGQEWSDNRYSYHGLQSVGGYSPAKLKIYQTMLDSCLLVSSDPSFPMNRGVMNMLNARYLLVPGQLPGNEFEMVNVDKTKRLAVYRNSAAMPRAWFAGSVVTVQRDAEVFRVLNAPDFNPARTAVIQSPGTPPAVEAPDSTASGSVTAFQSRRIVIKATTSRPALLVVSEIYYPAGWKAFVDGKETEIYRTNSVLRSLVVPAGTHEVVMSFDPPMYKAGYTLTQVAWALTLLCVIIGLFRDPAFLVRFRGARKQ